MGIHLIKLCVGADSVENLQSWIEEKQAFRARQGLAAEQIHTTRMTPKRQKDILDGGSLYWVIKGVVQARQKIIDLREVKGLDGIKRCEIVMSPDLVRTQAQPRRAFQGWRYLKIEDAPADLGALETAGDLPPAFRQELADLGLL
ncbi:MAG: DUF1489 domain-containing protein [Cohaesibacter sp.]|nr:DUF1489 domain-containing protein [Cohaesibacter sp.]MCV6603030.1 DUF1489 domain-containing protein [Cohaesibacter sp.]